MLRGKMTPAWRIRAPKPPSRTPSHVLFLFPSFGTCKVRRCQESLCQPPCQPLRQPFANLSPTLGQPFLANLFCQPLSKLLFQWAPTTRLETRANGCLVERRFRPMARNRICGMSVKGNFVGNAKYPPFWGVPFLYSTPTTCDPDSLLENRFRASAQEPEIGPRMTIGKPIGDLFWGLFVFLLGQRPETYFLAGHIDRNPRQAQPPNERWGKGRLLCNNSTHKLQIGGRQSAVLWGCEFPSWGVRWRSGEGVVRTLQKHPFGQPFLRTTPSPLLWRALNFRGWNCLGVLCRKAGNLKQGFLVVCLICEGGSERFDHRPFVRKSARPPPHPTGQSLDPKKSIYVLFLGFRLPGTRPEFLCFPKKSIREGASGLFGPGPERPQNISCSRATQTCTGATLGLL